MSLQQRGVSYYAGEYQRTLQRAEENREHIEKLIQNREQEIQEEFQRATQREIEIRGQLEQEYAKFTRLEEKEKEVCRNVQYYSFIASLLRLGPGGLNVLLHKMSWHGIDIITEVKNSQTPMPDHGMII
ncbi:hypothetical protein FBEOM_8696 [Fusarium beomiforme]|uniref:Uncharacterized protein n=1 Tax=Fusarium beomiforme TaxID=44412 RepID=A0A9P5AEU6_9HYPO|nr:hypothetical protein FBEOM_8696 [Fusarium beomiforme]